VQNTIAKDRPVEASIAPPTGQRLWEVDALRGVAILLMVVYHFAYDLVAYVGADIAVRNGGWLVLQRTTATLFLFLVGVSVNLRYHALARRGLSDGQIFLRFLRRGLWVFGWGMVITAITYVAVPFAFVIFGILHMIGTSMVLSFPFVKLRSRTALLVVVLLWAATSYPLQEAHFSFPWLLWLGFVPYNFATVDYFPLFPWFGVVLAGILFSKSFYPNFERQFALNDYSRAPLVRVASWAGSHSLAIYLIHQPILLALIFGWLFISQRL
jgi:uncharacterized membrane protein